MALAGKLDKKGYRVYVILGDGELQEGQIWEAAMTAAHYKLDNLTAILDFNGLQIDGPNREVKNIEPVADKFHDFDQIDKAIEEAKATKGKPTLIIAHTIKGKGVSFMENQVGWHGSAPNEEQRQKAIQELEGSGV
jgi:transketolase